MFTYGYEHLAGQMTTFLPTMQLVLEMDGSCTVLSEQLGKLQNSRKASMTVVSINTRCDTPFQVKTYPVSPSAMIGLK